MKLYALAALSLVFLFWTARQETTQRTQHTTEAKLVRLANEWSEATNKKDRKKLDELMAPEFALYAWNGKLLAPRPVWLDNLFSHITIEKKRCLTSPPEYMAISQSLLPKAIGLALSTVSTSTKNASSLTPGACAMAGGELLQERAIAPTDSAAEC
jgi:hypothetical protein